MSNELGVPMINFVSNIIKILLMSSIYYYIEY